MKSDPNLDFGALVLAAEDCEPGKFQQLHRFSRNDERILLKLQAHGPVLLRGGRGSGKSALMIEAARRLADSPDSAALGIYLSLRHLTLLRSTGEAYEKYLCSLLIKEVKDVLRSKEIDFDPEPNAADLHRSLARLSKTLSQRLVIFLDDAAHLGREASLEEFFDIYRTLSSSTVSCKATIYPGVTKFGRRFDVLNDATVVDLSRSEDLPGFDAFFAEVMTARYPTALREKSFGRLLSREMVAGVLGQAVVGNMRAFVFACNSLQERAGDNLIGYPELGDTLLDLSRNYYWQLLDEIEPKLGKYEPMVESARKLANALFETISKRDVFTRSALVLRDTTERLSKPFELLEYAGFLSKREASRALKSGGRGSRYALNLCLLFELSKGRLTRDQLDLWRMRDEPVEFHKTSKLSDIALPILQEEGDLEILKEPLSRLSKSSAYPYGLTTRLITMLVDGGIDTVGKLADASDEKLDSIDGIGPVTVRKLKNIVGQAIWM